MQYNGILPNDSLYCAVTELNFYMLVYVFCSYSPSHMICLTSPSQVSTQVSAQVRRELRALFYGSDDQTPQGEPDIPEGLLQWLSLRFVSGADLQALLANLELSILRNVSLQLEQSRAEARTEAEARAAVITTQTQAITQSAQHTAVGGGLSEEVDYTLHYSDSLLSLTQCYSLSSEERLHYHHLFHEDGTVCWTQILHRACF